MRKRPVGVSSGMMVPSTPTRPYHDAQLLCNYAPRLCGREKVAGHDFCLRHVLEDRSTSFKQCNYRYRGHRRCPRPSPKSDRKDGYCIEHSRKALVARQKTGRKRPSDKAVRALEELSHYKTENGQHAESEESLERLMRRIPSVSQRGFDGSEVESDEESCGTLETLWRGDDDHSDPESIDSEIDQPLKYAEFYTAEEVIRIMRDKLVRLQKLYIDQFQRLRYLLREAKRQYRASLMEEKEAELMSIHQQTRHTLEELTAYDKVKALIHYHNPQGLEAVLQSKLMEARVRLGELSSSSTSAPSSGSIIVASGSSSVAVTPKVGSLPKCSFHITSTVKCGEPVIPLTKFCIKHILEDGNQVLFRTCGFNPHLKGEEDGVGNTTDGPCESPIADVLENATCIFHAQFHPPYSSSFDDKGTVDLHASTARDLQPKVEEAIGI